MLKSVDTFMSKATFKSRPAESLVWPLEEFRLNFAHAITKAVI